MRHKGARLIFVLKRVGHDVVCYVGLCSEYISEVSGRRLVQKLRIAKSVIQGQCAQFILRLGIDLVNQFSFALNKDIDSLSIRAYLTLDLLIVLKLCVRFLYTFSRLDTIIP